MQPAAGGRNNKAEKIVMATFKPAFDRSRFKAADELAEPASVAVLGIDGSQSYTLTRPASTYACCSCPEGVQHKACKRHIAWLLPQAPDERQQEAVHLIVQLLGSRLDFVGGCTIQDIRKLFCALKALHDQPCGKMPECRSSGIQAKSPDMQDDNCNIFPAQENVPVNGHADLDRVSSKPAPPGVAAMQNNVRAISHMVNAQLEQVAQADPGKQPDLMTMQTSVLVQLSENSRIAATKPHELQPDFVVNKHYICHSSGKKAS